MSSRKIKRVSAEYLKSLGALPYLWKNEDIKAMERLLNQVRFGRNKTREIVIYAQEISVREGLEIRKILQSQEITQILQNENLNPPQKAFKIKELLYSRRFPRISEYIKKYKSIRSKIPWPKKISINAIDLLEEGLHRVSFTFKDIFEFKENIEKLQTLARNEGFIKMFGKERLYANRSN